MKQEFTELHEALYSLVGLHRQLLDLVRLEKEALVAADIPTIQEITYKKEVLLQSLRQAEIARQRTHALLAQAISRNMDSLPLSEVIILLQGDDPKLASGFQSLLNTLNVIIKHIRDQNEQNKALVEKALQHVQQMKKNVLDEKSPHSNVYTSQAQNVVASSGSHLISKEV